MELTYEQQASKFSLDHLQKAWFSLNIGSWKKEMEDNRPMNKKNIIADLLTDLVFHSDALAMDLFRENDSTYIGLSLGVRTSTEDSVLDFLRKFDPTA